MNEIIKIRNNKNKKGDKNMYYNFTNRDLQSKQRIREYKEFAQEVLSNMETVEEMEGKLRELDNDASMVITIGNLDYKTDLEHNITATGEIYSADRLRQIIHVAKMSRNLEVNVQFQEGTGLENDPYEAVADISFEYNPDEKSVNLGEILSTQDLQNLRQGNKIKEEDKNQDCER